jgi:hypothetical protein
MMAFILGIRTPVRITSIPARIERTTGGRPRRLSRDRAACRPLIRLRCQRSTVSARTSNRIRRNASGLSRCSSAADNARSGGEPDLHPAQLAFQNRDLMPQDEDLHVLVPIAHRKKTQYRKRVHRCQVGQSQQHDRPSCPDNHLAVTIPAYIKATKPNVRRRQKP